MGKFQMRMHLLAGQLGGWCRKCVTDKVADNVVQKLGGDLYNLVRWPPV